jgi:hypothetical protein
MTTSSSINVNPDSYSLRFVVTTGAGNASFISIVLLVPRRFSSGPRGSYRSVKNFAIFDHATSSGG